MTLMWIAAVVATLAGMAEAQPAFVQGTYGEPFTVEALVQGCDDEGCSFYAEGWRWMALRDGVSNPAVLDALAALPVNSPVILSGDMIGMGDITVEAGLLKLEPGVPDAFAGLRDAMQGDWVSQTDPQDRISVLGSEEVATYGAEQTGVSVLGFANSCDGGDDIGPVVRKQMMGGDPADVLCLAVIAVEPARMELSLVGRGNTLVYLRP